MTIQTVTRYAGTISQTSGTTITSYSNLANLKNSNNTYAKTSKIGSKTATKKNPPTIYCSNFGFNIPKGAEIQSITVEYAHQKLDDVEGKYPSIGANTIVLTGTGLASSIVNVTHSSPSKTLTSKECKYDGSIKSVKNQYEMPNIDKINSNNFGVKIDYPENTNNYTGYLQLKYIRIKVTYNTSTYSVMVQKVDSTEPDYAGLSSQYQITLNNSSLTDYTTSVNIQLPTNASINLENMNIEGYFEKLEDDSYGWIPIQGKSIPSSSIILDVVFPEQGDYNPITVTEQLTQVTASTSNITVYPTPTGYIAEDTRIEQIIYAKTNTEFTIPITLPEAYWELEQITLSVSYPAGEEMRINDSLVVEQYDMSVDEFIEGKAEVTCTVTGEGAYTIVIGENYMDNIDSPDILIHVVPDTLLYPAMSIIQLTQEELDRMGKDIAYEIRTPMRVNIDVNDTDDFHDYYRNFRIGVVNQELQDQSTTHLFEACTNWSNVMTTFNNWEEKIIDFTYDGENPVFLIVTGPFNTEQNTVNFSFANPCISEFGSSESYLKEGTFPEPFLNVLSSNDGSKWDLTNQQTSNPLIFYDFPLEEDFGTGEDFAVVGFELKFNVETEDQIVANAELINANGVIGEESIVINHDDSEVSIGGKYDLYGFTIGEMIDMDKWSLKLTLNNIYDTVLSEEYVNEINIHNTYAIIYLETLDEGLPNKVYIEGENLEWYNVFLNDFKITSGLKTDTKYINVEGTDTNYSHNMSIREKEIELEFSIDACTLEESTRQLQAVARLFTNERDELNRPFPKRLTTSFYPNVYFEYILEEGIEAEVNMSGYDCKAKLTIPSGTSYQIEDTTTNNTGYVQSLAKVNPYIVIIPSSSNVTVTENFTGQTFSISNTNILGKFVEIDCENRICWLRENQDVEIENITKYCDYNNDWFLINGSYNFTCSGGTIQTISYNERS